VSSTVASQSVTSSRRSWPALDAAPVRPVFTDSVPFSGPSLNRTAILRSARHGRRP
jgi:hypothetical protein